MRMLEEAAARMIEAMKTCPSVDFGVLLEMSAERVPHVIDKYVPLADARIFTREEMRAMLCELVKDIFDLQVSIVSDDA